MSQSEQESDEGGAALGPSYVLDESAPTRIPHHGRGASLLSGRRLLVVLFGVVGLVAQMFLLSLAWELWDLSMSLMEVWAELARKHLEIMLSE